MRLLSKHTLLFTLGASIVGACRGETPDITTPVDPPPPAETQGLELTSVDSVAQEDMFWSPLDATPSPEGDRVYFTASTADGPAVLAVSASGGAAQVLYAGELLAAPFGVVASLDGARLFISDSGAQAEDDEEAPVGGVYVMMASGGDPVLLSGTEGTMARSLHVSEIDGQEVLHFTGIDSGTETPSVFRIQTAGGALSVVASGAPLAQPSGITVDSAGVVYVADSGASEDGTGSALLRIKDGQVERLAQDLRLGYPAGLALDMAETTLLASGLADDADTSVVHSVTLSDGKIAQVSEGIGHNSESGGVHRAHGANVFAWANSDGDETNPAGGNVYVLKAAP